MNVNNNNKKESEVRLFNERNFWKLLRGNGNLVERWCPGNVTDKEDGSYDLVTIGNRYNTLGVYMKISKIIGVIFFFVHLN